MKGVDGLINICSQTQNTLITPMQAHPKANWTDVGHNAWKLCPPYSLLHTHTHPHSNAIIDHLLNTSKVSCINICDPRQPHTHLLVHTQRFSLPEQCQLWWVGSVTAQG